MMSFSPAKFSTFLLCLLILPAIHSAQEIPYYVSPKGLLAWIPFEGTTLDKSGNSNDATGYRLNATEDRFGKPDKAIYLDGINSYVMMEINNPDLLMSDNFTISIWALPNFANRNQYLFSKGDKLSNEYAIVYSGDNNLCFEKESRPFNYCTPIIKNKWVNITLVMQKNTATIYFDGKKVNTIILQSPIMVSTLPYTFGAIFENGTSTPVQNTRFAGKLDDIAIWNRVLTPDEIALFYKGEEN